MGCIIQVENFLKTEYFVMFHENPVWIGYGYLLENITERAISYLMFLASIISGQCFAMFLVYSSDQVI